MADEVIIIYPTLTVIADAGGSRDVELRGKTTRFMDTYDVLSYVGQREYDTNTRVSFSGTYEEVSEIDMFLKQNIRTPFWFKFARDEKARLYNVVGSFGVSHINGLKYTITITLKEADVFGIVGSEEDVSLIADILHKVVNIILPTTESAYEVEL